jgi:hypothetical protein
MFFGRDLAAAVADLRLAQRSRCGDERHADVNLISKSPS